VGLSGNAGTLTLGRQYVPHYNLVDDFDPFGTGAGSAAESGVVSITSRANNSVVYQSPKLGDFSGSAMVALSENTTGTKSNGNLYSASLTYAPGALSLGLSVSDIKRSTDALVDAKYLLLTAAYDFGSFKLTGGAQTVQNLSGDDSADRREAFAGVLVPVGTDTLSAGFGVSKAKDVSGYGAQQWTLGYAHPLSKRTKVYAFATHINNGSLTAYTADAATGAGPVTTEGKNVSALLLGIRHAF
jgi:predicted porin